MKLMIFIVYLFSCVVTIWSKTSRCDRRPSINGICTTATVGIYYDQDTEKCKYQGCGNGKKLFESLEECDRVCNNRRRNRRVQASKNGSTSTTSTTPSTTSSTTTLSPSNPTSAPSLRR